MVRVIADGQIAAHPLVGVSVDVTEDFRLVDVPILFVIAEGLFVHSHNVRRGEVYIHLYPDLFLERFE